MKFLIVTQVIDTEHPILGFFHRWVEEFAQHCEQVHVICLQEGKHLLPKNVTVHSLGKEHNSNPISSLREVDQRETPKQSRSQAPSLAATFLQKLRYAVRFYKLIWSLRHEYDHVFVHMNQIYVILGAPFWRAAGKRVGLWYMHGTVSLTLRIAERLTDRIFTGSLESFKLRSSKVVVTGHGIDTGRFAPQHDVIKDFDLITVGRITSSKNLTMLVEALVEIRKEYNVSLTIVGTAVTESEKAYEASLQAYITTLGLTDYVHCVGRVSQAELPWYLNRAKIFVTAAQNGSLDKAVLEPMACGVPIVSMAPGCASLPLGTAQTTNPQAFVTEVKKVLESEVFENPEYAAYIRTSHSLATLIPKIVSRI